MTCYSKFTLEKMILRDHLALERTLLASERTLLAYGRTAVALFASGLGMLTLLKQLVFACLGYAFMFLSPFVLVFGIYRFIQVRRKLSFLRMTKGEVSETEKEDAGDI